jgi:hypothetical protein
MAAVAQRGLHYSQGLLTAGVFVAAMAALTAVLFQARILTIRIGARLTRRQRDSDESGSEGFVGTLRAVGRRDRKAR